MIVLYTFCASLMVKYSATIMQSVNIHIIKIFNKTCRRVIKILGLICTCSKRFPVAFSISLFSLFLAPCETETAYSLMRSLKNLEVTSSLIPVLQP